MVSPQHDPGIIATIVADVRHKLRSLIERIEKELPAHISLHNTKQALEEASRAIADHPTQREGSGHPNLAQQNDLDNLKAAGHLPDSGDLAEQDQGRVVPPHGSGP